MDQDKLRFGQMGSAEAPMLSNLQEGEPTAATQYQGVGNLYGRIDLQNMGETQQNLIRHQQLNPHLYKRGPTKY